VLLVKTIADKLDMKIVFKVIDDAKAFSLVTEDEDTGFYADLTKRKIDIMVCLCIALLLVICVIKRLNRNFLDWRFV